LEKVYDHLKKFGQSLGTPPLKVRITQTTQTNTNFFIGLVEFGRILPPNVQQITPFEKKKIYQSVSKIFAQCAHHTTTKTGINASMRPHQNVE